MSVAPFLVEIGTEELPPKALKSLHEAFAEGIAKGLQQADLTFSGIEAFATPRRLGVQVSALQTQQADRTEERLGPNVQAAFDANGNPTKAAEGFARSNGTSVAELEQVETDKGLRLAFRLNVPGKSAAELLPQIVSNALAELPIPKRMRWGASRAEFVRPVHWLVMLLGDQVVAGEVLGLSAGRTTYGHRFHYNQAIELNAPADYRETLRSPGHVIVNFAERRATIEQQVAQIGQQLGGQAIIDADLLDEVTGLVEWPVALAGNFEERFLEVPAEALISSMKEHQKYFHVLDAQQKLLPHFITVANLVSQDPQQVINGNERVIRPRLSDAAFFYNTDRKTPLIDRRRQLGNIVFQAQLGTLLDKAERIERLASHISEQISGNVEYARRAGQLSKCDLVTDMVFEFDDLQGIMGHYYARHDGEAAEVASALEEQYWPRFAGDQLPSTPTGIALALADRLDTLVGIFGIGQPPSGSKDPFALRRATLGVLRILIERELDLDLAALIDLAIIQHGDLPKLNGLRDTVLAYMLERLRARYEEQSIAVESFLAVSAKGLSNPLDIEQRVHAVHLFSQLHEANALAAANKRVSNLLAKAEGEPSPTVNAALLLEPAEHALAEAIAVQQQQVKPLLDARDYQGALRSLASLQVSVDRFFDEVMVMADDSALRDNRLALLNQLRSLFLAIADISLLAVK